MCSAPSDFLFALNLARAAAQGTKCNPRNLELIWYPFWTQAMFLLARHLNTRHCLVAPQYPLWTRDDTQLGDLVILDDDEDLAVDAIDDDEDNNNNNDDDNDNDSTGASTTNETLSVKTRSWITDFALLCRFENDEVNPDEAVVINHEFIPALIEVKRSASRESTGEELAEAQKGLLLHAKQDVYRQALYLFANPRWSRQKSVVVIAATGDLWSYTTISRDDHLAQTAGANDTDPDWEPNTLHINALQWSEIAVWGREGEDTKRVDEVINRIRDCVR